MNIGQVTANAWEQVLRESPDPWWDTLIFSGTRHTYRERLDRQLFNVFGQPIPRIVTVRRNIRRLRRPRRAPRLPA